MNYNSTTLKIIDLLKEKSIFYEIYEHTPVRTSEEAARVRPDFSLKQGAKAIIVKAYVSKNNFDYVMLVIPGDKKFFGNKVKKFLKTKELRFATAEEVEKVTNGVLVGGVPPFGSIFGLKTYLDEGVLENESIIFNAGDRSISLSLKSRDFIKVGNPTICVISQ